MTPPCQALDIILKLVDAKGPVGPETALIINCRDGSVLTLAFTPPPDEPQSGTIH